MPDERYYQTLLDTVSAGAPAWQATIVQSDGSTPAKAGMKMIIPLAGNVCGNLGGGELEHLIIAGIRANRIEVPQVANYLLSDLAGTPPREADGIPTGMICGGRVSVYVEPLHNSRRLYVIGAGHCGKALAHLAGLCGYRVRLIDERPEILESVPPEYGAELKLTDFSDLDELIAFDAQARIVIMTHGHTHDQLVLERCLGKPCRYLGMIGSSAKVGGTFRRLREQGWSEADLNRVHAPVGLPIGSQTPYQIAVSILAELIGWDAPNRVSK